MVREGALDDPKVQAVFGLHVSPRFPVGAIAYRSEGMMAAADALKIVVHGKQTHGAYPWLGVDPIVVASQIVLGLQMIPSRQLDTTHAPALVTIGSMHGGVRNNIIPDSVEMLGTIRTLDSAMRDEMHARIRRTAGQIAESAGAKAEVTITTGFPITYNDPKLSEWIAPVLARSAAKLVIANADAVLGAEDFAFYQQKVPGVFFWVGIRPPSQSPEEAGSSHSPLFYIDESGLIDGVRALANVAVEYLK